MKDNRCNYIRFLPLIIPLFLVFLGMRVPDLSRPQKPKPMRLAVLDKTPVETVLQSVTKIEVDPDIATGLTTLALPATEEAYAETDFIRASIPLLLLSQFPPRAPPAANNPA
ncbi:MAG: hypothetical protein PHR66_10855 [Desulfuromonadaceae bacterium]|nr:hypothetical protein [Desulfuromonadaceae bacterium]